MRTVLQRVVPGLLLAIASASAFAQSADLSVLKTGPNTASAGTDVTFVITASSAGPDDATSVTITDPIPAGMTFTSATQTSGPAFACAQAAGTVTCSIATFPAGSIATFNFVFGIPSGTPDGTLFINTATISSATPDDNPENNSSTWGTSTPPPPTADISITKSGPTSAAPNTNVTYTIVVANPSSNNATSVTWQDNLPVGVPGGAQMTFVSMSPTTGCTTPAPGFGGTINCDLGTLAASSSITYTLVGHIPSGTTSGTTFTNTATINSTNDPDAENNTSSTSLTVSSVDVSVTKTGPATVNAGAPLSYAITVSNAGPDVATNVNLADVVPAGTTFTSIVQNSGPAAACNGGPTVGCNIPLLGPGASAQFTLTVTVGNTPAVSNTATVTTDSFDTNLLNNSSTVSTTVIAQADLSVSKTGPAVVLAGANITYNLTVMNNGASDATAVSLTDALPPNTTFVSFTAPAGWTKTTPAVGATGTVTATNGSMLATTSASLTLVVQVSAATPSGTAISNTATVASATPDPNSANNSSTATSTVSTSLSDLSITKSASPPSPAYPLGFDVTFTLTAANSGPNAANLVTVTDTLPGNMTFVSANTTQGTCSGTSTVTCSLGTLAVGGSATITIVARTASLGASSNTATISSSSSDANPANNTATVSFLVLANIPALSPLLLALLAAMLGAIAVRFLPD